MQPTPSSLLLLQDKIDAMKCTEFVRIHHDVVRQVAFIPSLNSFISAAESVVPKSAYLPSIVIGNLAIRESRVVFRMSNVSDAAT